MEERGRVEKRMQSTMRAAQNESEAEAAKETNGKERKREEAASDAFEEISY